MEPHLPQSRVVILLTFCLGAPLFAASLEDAAPVLTLSGSGTTNPSKLLWRVFDRVEQRAGRPVRVTYRAVGSGTGIKEFVGRDNQFESLTNFASADIPLPSEDLEELANSGNTALQIPFVLGAVSFFHTLSAGTALQLSPCLLARIFSGKVTTWDDPEILAENPSIEVDPSTRITVIRRSDGSSSTSAVTAYLNKACPGEWDNDNVGKEVTWFDGTVAAAGSGGVTAELESTPFGIAYLSSGYGHGVGLKEVKIQNRDGNYLAWPEANVSAALLEVEGFPENLTEDMSGVDLTHLPGPKTWPMTQLSYLFVREDQTELTETGPFLKAVIEMLLSPEVQENVFPEYGFSALPQRIIDIARTNLDEKMALAEGADEWLAETDDVLPLGQTANVISAKRRSWAEEEIDRLSADVSDARLQLEDHLGRQVHGSGTTNPSGLLWHVMEILEDRSTVPLELTYRAVGSSTGQKEFIGSDNGYQPYNDFGSGDLPLLADQYKELKDEGHEVIQLPFLIGAVGVFHNVPEHIVGSEGLSLDSCLLARIFQANITSWDNPDILAQNPQMRGKVSAEDKITVFHRDLGSSSTAGFTSYIEKACPEEWKLGSGSSLSTWPSITKAVQGSQGMVKAISETPFGIGYVDAGFGWNHNLEELALKNRAGKLVTTKTADVPEAARAAVQSGGFPSSTADDFSEVDLLDQPGDATWPITLFSYIYVRRDLKHLGRSAGVLHAMLHFLHSEEVQGMFGDFGFFPPPSEVVQMNRRGIDELILPPGTERWEFESPDETRVGNGAQRFVFSGKRHTFTKYQTQLLSNRLDALKADVENSAFQQQIEDLRESYQSMRGIAIAAVALAVVSLLLSGVAAVLLFSRRSASYGSPCRDPNMSHIPMKEQEPDHAANEADPSTQA
uniref:Phosphate abc transporter substrate-binding protein n=1 Tax=Tetraselmis sp. GSL018 TaxID=582737 RepID=A0A061RD09_9CHLO|mmetsp:Transcript_10223/g.24392  ORF Transcript_10223/g.24392 Transcript_10223/m.24392 type:complete len:902 (+) Transcript_10223:165-2870(+)|eukprot:CAMPEP_0177586928 /NCGR_PEP_ID=MMETSP0419_2-20121207/5354_1 /TAXON_ID=582737 /ORGANISM="Tetraselmis sp., Strain GSL018" /LENGTH=901 /DNA_ID=CAMNT_0019076893 /DNA_START=106 /DNA_END=2811 /DNA_ORIENTATION=+